jgi:glycosyltransferase involved in cell wall biosynthesis
MINLSYIIATKNRLPYLKITLLKLISFMKNDEEILVVDGNSTDGTKEYLQQLFNEGKIHQFISEPDRNQAHAWNKAMLMSNGTIIKKIIDDDVHDYDAIGKCKNFMLANTSIDICISDNLESNLTDPSKIGVTGRLPEFKRWKDGLVKSFTFSDVSMLIRKSSLSFLGLYDTQFKMIDWEYALRVSYLQASIAYYTGCNAIGVSTPGNVSSTATKQLLQFEGRVGMLKYKYAGDTSDISFYSHIKIGLGKLYYELVTKKRAAKNLDVMPPNDHLQQIYSLYYQKLNDYNKKDDFIFIY